MFLVAKERRFMMIQMPSLRAPSETSPVRDADLFRKHRPAQLGGYIVFN
jgi:hypothetical protein